MNPDPGTDWLAIITAIAACLAAVGTFVGSFLVRRTGKGTVKAAQEAAAATSSSATAAIKSVAVAKDAVGVAERSVEKVRKTARELDVWRKREETMRMVRWASDMATSDGRRRGKAGMMILEMLATNNALLQEVDREFVEEIELAVKTVARSLVDEPMRSFRHGDRVGQA